MKKITIVLFSLLSAQVIFADETHTAPDGTGTFVVPTSSIRNFSDTGVTQHTFDVMFVPNATGDAPPSGCETPASLACVYGLTSRVSGCPISGTTAIPSTGAGKTVVIVDGYDNSDQTTDLQQYSTQFNLPTPNLTIYHTDGSSTCLSGATSSQGWQDEHDLDLQMVHAMAPNARIIMVEGKDGSNSEMRYAEQCATTLITNAGGGIISNSWGGDEYAGETANDVDFQNNGVVYVYSSGDYSAPARYPSSSPYVISAGASSILRDSAGNFTGEAAWSTTANTPLGSKSGTSGGPSAYEPRPAFQNAVVKTVGTARGTPDISFDGDPQTGVCVYSTYAHTNYGKYWIKDGGTSVAAPALSGILTSAGYTATSSQDMLRYIYTHAMTARGNYWRDGLSGNNGYPALAGYDFVTGLGTPLGYDGK